jgi:hypothetical protein
MKFVGQVACKEIREMITKFGLENLKERAHLKDLGIVVKMLMNIHAPKIGDFFTIGRTITLSDRTVLHGVEDRLVRQ